jgi:hypothetical protein
MPLIDRNDVSTGNVVPAGQVHWHEAPRRVCTRAPGEAAEPKIIVIKEGDAVQAIEIICTCGERIRLNCIY